MRRLLILSLLLLVPRLATAQTLDQFGVTNPGAHSNTQTLSVTVNSHTNQVLYIFVHWLALVSPSDDVSSVSVNGTTSGVTSLAGTHSFNGTSGFSIAVYRVVSPTVGTYNAVVTFPNTVDGSLEYFTVYGVNTSSPERSTGKNQAGSGNATLSITSGTGDVILDAVSAYHAAIINPTNGQNVDNTDNHDTIAIAGGNLAGSAGTVALGWTLTGTTISWAEAAISVTNSGGGGGFTPAQKARGFFHILP